MSSAWERYEEQQRRLRDRFARLIPDMSYVNSFQNNFSLIESVIQSHQQLVSQLSGFDKLVDTPAIMQMRQMAEWINKTLPDYSQSFLLSSSVLEAMKHSSLLIPDYLESFSKISTLLVHSTNVFASELTALTKFDPQRPLVFDNLPDFLIAPVVSGSAHFQNLRDLDFIDLEFDEQTEEDYSEFIDETCYEADAKIATVDQEWLILLQGAEQSLVSKNPDRVRHTITSLRELMTQILHHFAPDSEVLNAFDDPQLTHDGKPTRRARIKFILMKKYDNSALLNIVEKDTAACVDLFNLYQQGTHEVVSVLDDQELRFIVKRTKLLIEQLVL